MEQIHEGSNVAGHRGVERNLEVMCFDHATRLHQAVAAGTGLPAGTQAQTRTAEYRTAAR